MRIVVTLTLEGNIDEDDDPVKEAKLAEMIDDPQVSILLSDDGEFPIVLGCAGNRRISFVCHYAQKVALVDAGGKRGIVKQVEFDNLIL